MKNKKWIRYVESFIILPALTTNILSISPVASLQKENNVEVPEVTIRAEAIDKYFADRGMPLAGEGMKMVVEADKNDLDWRLLPAIAVRESTGGKNACKKAAFNSFGWGSCKISFNSNDEAIETVAKNLGGNNPNTARHYDDKTTKEILRAYNPPSVVPHYAEQVMSIMSSIGQEDLSAVSIENS